jgi:RHS repeat-associated protein
MGISNSLYSETLSDSSGYNNTEKFYHGLYASAQTNYGTFTPAPPTNQYAYKFHYDKYGRLDIAANTYKTNWSIGTTNPTTYDLDGNLTQLQRASMGSKSYTYKTGTNTPQTIGSWNYSADATGNITSAGSSSTTMTYDPFTELTMREVKGTRKQNYQYDGKKERVLKIDSNGTVVKTLYLQGLNDYPLMVINGSNEYMYVYGIGGMVAMRVNGTWFYIMRDHLGSTKLIISNTSFVAARYEYDPYGKILDTSSITTGSNYQFTGQELDETGLYNFRARMYDTSAAIFYAADPANQGASRYGYCGGNPVIMVDPTGKYWEPNYYVDGVQISSENYNENYASHVDTYMQGQHHGMFNDANHQRQHQRNLASLRKSLTSLDGLMGSSDGSSLFASGGGDGSSRNSISEDSPLLASNGGGGNDDIFSKDNYLKSFSFMNFPWYGEMGHNGMFSLQVAANYNLPKGYSLTDEGGIQGPESEDNGLTLPVTKGSKLSNVWIAPDAFSDLRMLYLTVGHELIHVDQIFKGYYGDINMEPSAYLWNNQIRQSRGWWDLQFLDRADVMPNNFTQIPWPSGFPLK